MSAQQISIYLYTLKLKVMRFSESFGTVLMKRDLRSALKEPLSYPLHLQQQQPQLRSLNGSPLSTTGLPLQPTYSARVGFSSPTAQAIAATAQVQRRKWNSLMSRFRYRTTCFISHSALQLPVFSLVKKFGKGGNLTVQLDERHSLYTILRPLVPLTSLTTSHLKFL